MENNILNNELTHYQMELLLPDYVLGKLTNDEIILFESNLYSYPDLAREVTDARNVFAKIDKMGLDSKNTYRSRNVSVKLQDKLAHRLKPQRRFRFVLRIVVPSLALFAMVLYILTSPEFLGKNDTAELAFSSYKIPAIFNSEELSQIFNFENEENYYFLDDEFQNVVISDLNQDYSTAGNISDYFYDDFEESDDYYPLNFIDFETKYLDKIDEEIFQQILEELENVDVNS